MLVLGSLAGDIAAQGFLESPLAAANQATNTIRSLGVDIDVSGIVIRTPGGLALSVADLTGAPLPGNVTPGYLGGTIFADVELTPLGLVATGVTMTVPETVLIGNVTQNDPGTGLEGRDFSVMGIEIRAANDPRLDPFEAIINGLPVNIPTIPLGALCAAVGYLGEDGVFYAQVLEAEAGEVLGGPQIAVQRARCRTGDLEVRGAASVPSGTVEILNEADAIIAAGAINPLDGTFAVRARGVVCPGVLRARHQPSGAVSEPFAPAAN